MHLAHLVLAVAAVIGVAVPFPSDPGPDPGPDDPVPVVYRAPVDAPIADPFRPPPTPYGPGNRGIEYATSPGTVVRAAAAGVVVFAGPVAATLHVTVAHPDGLRSSYSFLATVAVGIGQEVAGGSVLGTTADHLHFGVRSGDEYLDPAALLSGDVATRVHLVPHRPSGEAPRTGPAAEVAALLPVVVLRLGSTGPGDRLATIGSLLAAAPTLLPPAEGAAGHLRLEATTAPRVLRLVAATGRWLTRSRRCTPADAAVPPTTGRRIVVLVGGFGSTSASAGIDDLDTAALGYAGGDVVRFSYAGGRTPGTGTAVPGIDAHAYDAADTEGDLRLAGERLAELLRSLAAAAPGIPLDVVAHSQGGLVARLAVTSLDAHGELAPAGADPGTATGTVPLGLVATLGTPHQGTDLATTVTALQASDGGSRVLDLLEATGSLPGDPDAPATRDLSETSDLVADLRRWGVPPGVHLLSVAARGDLTVASSHTVVAGADHAVVPLVGPSAHDGLPGDATTRRELGLALAGLAPGCQTLGAAVTDAVAAEAITSTEDTAGLVAAAAAARIGRPDPDD